MQSPLTTSLSPASHLQAQALAKPHLTSRASWLLPLKSSSQTLQQTRTSSLASAPQTAPPQTTPSAVWQPQLVSVVRPAQVRQLLAVTVERVAKPTLILASRDLDLEVAVLVDLVKDALF